MVYMMYSVLDTKSGLYNLPFSAVARGAALRVFGDVCNDPKTSIHAHPEDYNLFEIGTFDDATGEMKAEPLVALGNASSFIIHRPETVPLKK